MSQEHHLHRLPHNWAVTRFLLKTEALVRGSTDLATGWRRTPFFGPRPSFSCPLDPLCSDRGNIWSGHVSLRGQNKLSGVRLISPPPSCSPGRMRPYLLQKPTVGNKDSAERKLRRLFGLRFQDSSYKINISSCLRSNLPLSSLNTVLKFWNIREFIRLAENCSVTRKGIPRLLGFFSLQWLTLQLLVSHLTFCQWGPWLWNKKIMFNS